MMYLVDTNIFLEVLLIQDRKENCKNFLNANIGNLHISDFALHSIGVILFKTNKEQIFQKFAEDVIPKLEFLTLSEEGYAALADIRKNLGLDFDDAYQFKIAEENNLEIVTLDGNFEKAKDRIRVLLL